MKVTELGDNYWQVESDRSWWTAKKLPHLPGGWHIENAKGVQVGPDGALGRKIIRAIAKKI